jgi:glycosyltransferase involved in cell wall biosynthesis
VKLGVVTTSYPRFAGDGAGSFVAGHVGALRALGHEVEVIAAGDPGPACESLEAPVHRVGGRRLFYRGGAPDALERVPIRAGTSAVMFTARLAAAVTRHAPRWDAIIAHWLVPSAFAALPSTRPLLAIVHGGDLFTLRRLRLVRPVLHALHCRQARLVFVSTALRAAARDAAPALAPWFDAAIVQPMGIDVPRFAALARTPSDPPIVLVAARLVPIKGVDVAIAAMQHVRSDARLVIAGDGPERVRLTAMLRAHVRSGGVTTERAQFTCAARAHLLAETERSPEHRAMPEAPEQRSEGSAEGNMRGGRMKYGLLGEVTTERRDELLRTAGVVVIPSRVLPSGRTEGTPAIALEALAAGVPVIASAVGGLCDLPGVRLVPPENPYELARAIDQILANPPSSASLRAGVAPLDWRAIAPRLIRE